jgi:hypothetical protein
MDDVRQARPKTGHDSAMIQARASTPKLIKHERHHSNASDSISIKIL